MLNYFQLLPSTLSLCPIRVANFAMTKAVCQAPDTDRVKL